jgi:hypothetical protein
MGTPPFLSGGKPSPLRKNPQEPKPGLVHLDVDALVSTGRTQEGGLDVGQTLHQDLGWRGLRVALPHQVDHIHFELLGKVHEGAGLLIAGSPDGDRPVVKFGLGHDARSIRAPLASNDMATASASDAVPLRIMATSHQFDSSLEALSNILYLLRRSLDNPAKVTKYLDFADQLLVDIAASRRLHPVHSPGD